jgi:hypothetical protein
MGLIAVCLLHVLWLLAGTATARSPDVDNLLLVGGDSNANALLQFQNLPLACQDTSDLPGRAAMPPFSGSGSGYWGPDQADYPSISSSQVRTMIITYHTHLCN